MIYAAKTGHTGGAMSCIDILTCLYYRVMKFNPSDPSDPGRDRFILSKGHSVEGLLAILADVGYIDKSELRTFSKLGSRLIGHPNNRVPGVEFCTGSLGHGLSLAAGVALGAKRMGGHYRAYVVMGDGEQAEGSVWEASMFAAHYGLDNLFAIIDRNGLQISGPTERVMALDNLAEKYTAFGWDVTECDGNDIKALISYFESARPSGKPHMLVARTVKGKGLPFAENKPEWHHKVPTADQLREAYAVLNVPEVGWLQ
ncbi:transketolase, N-terminal subunit [Clostridia bacterium]|nr:transketolase, N-terminal subunit [Clostridia bacterium]